MSIESELRSRSESQCELCSASSDLSVFAVEPKAADHPDHCALLCTTCTSQIEDPSAANANHWRCLSESMWSEQAPVKVLAWRMLNYLSVEG